MRYEKDHRHIHAGSDRWVGRPEGRHYDSIGPDVRSADLQVGLTYVVPTFRSALTPALYAAQLTDTSLAADIEKLGGHVVRDAKGNIVEVSLARTWATDADVERVAASRR